MLSDGQAEPVTQETLVELGQNVLPTKGCSFAFIQLVQIVLA